MLETIIKNNWLDFWKKNISQATCNMGSWPTTLPYKSVRMLDEDTMIRIGDLCLNVKGSD